jgi:FtsH-binding integral membrane protein
MSEIDERAEQRDTGHDTTRTRSLSLFAAALVLSLLACVLVSYIMPQFQAMFREMDVALPQITLIALHPMFQLVFPALCVAGIVKELLIRKKRVTLALNVVYLCLVVAVLLFCVLATFLPIIPLT